MWHLDDPGAAEHGCHGKRVHGAPHLVSLLYVRCTHVNFWILEIQLVREVCTFVREVFERCVCIMLGPLLSSTTGTV